MSSGQWGGPPPVAFPLEGYPALHRQQAAMWPSPVTREGTYASEHEGLSQPSAHVFDIQGELVHGGPRVHVGTVTPDTPPELLIRGSYGDDNNTSTPGVDGSHVQSRSPSGQEPLTAHEPIASSGQCYDVGDYTPAQYGRGLNFGEVQGGLYLPDDRSARSGRFPSNHAYYYEWVPGDHPFTAIRHSYAVRDPLDFNSRRGDRDDSSPHPSVERTEDITTAQRAVSSEAVLPYPAPAPRDTVTTPRRQEAAKKRRSAASKASYSCPYDPRCSATFTRRSSARNHALAHENKQAYVCERGCERRFNTDALRRSHYKKMH